MSDETPKPIDAGYLVEVAPDGLTAWLTVTPPRDGGSAPSLEGARQALQAPGIKEGIDVAAVEAALGAQLGTRLAIARGTAPESGIDGWLEPIVDVNRQRHPTPDDKGHFDFRDQGAIPSVNAGDALMRHHPPRPGKAGRTVTGRDLPVMAPKDKPFAVRLQGVAPDPADPQLLRAATAGQPILQRDGISVEAILKLENVDIAVGNIDFIGSVEIRGDVQSGMRIKAGGDVTVNGTIESAEIITGGDLIARAGIIGIAAEEQKGTQEKGTARIHAKGNVKARYLENCVVQAEQSVFVDEAIIQCDVTAIDQVVVGKKGSGKGRIIGGWVRATTGVSAEILGGPGSGETRVFVGVNPLLQRALEERKQRVANKLKEHGELSKIIKLLKDRPDKKEMTDKARLTLRKVNEEIAEAMEEERNLEAEIHFADQARIVVSKMTYGGVMVAIGKKSRFVADDTGAGVFVIANNEIVYGDLAAYGG